ncbi:MAG: hypothetical protein ACE5IA_02610 [Dehalococcoidia bacterium]
MVRKRILPLALAVAVSLTTMVALAHISQAQTVKPAAISAFSVTTKDGADVTDKTLMAGATYKVDFTLTVAEGLKDRLTMDTGLQKTGDIYWRLGSEYPGIDTETWQPGQSAIAFEAVAGEARFSLTGVVPSDYAIQQRPNGDVLHKAKSIRLVALSLASGVLVEQREAVVIDQSIDNFLKALRAKGELLQGTGTQPVFAELVRSNLRVAQSQGDSGYIDGAMEILGAVPDRGWPAPQRSEIILFAAAGGIGLLAFIFLLLFFRARAGSGFVRQRVVEQVRKLDLTEAKVIKTGDSVLAREIGEIKTELEKISGR